MDKNGDFILDCDFIPAVDRIVNSAAADCFEWLNKNRITRYNPDSWSIGIDHVYTDPDLTLDPKRYGKKVMQLRDKLSKNPHVLLSDLVEFIPERQTSKGSKVKINKSAIYNYVEIQDIIQGDYSSKELRGWELPSRAKHFAEPNDIYFGSIWGSVVKWCYIPDGANNIVVTNGCFRCRMKEEKKDLLPDLLSYLNSEGWAVQMRSLARGSDGLAEICIEDASNVIIPLLSDKVRNDIMPTIIALKTGTTSLNSIIKNYIKSDGVMYNDPPKRPSHIVLV